MTITATPPSTDVVPAAWLEHASEGVQIIRNLRAVKDAEEKVRRRKTVDARALGCKIINENFNGHLGFRGIILKMVSNGSIKEEQRRAAVYLVERFLATVR
jgi:hypothetical protein